MTQKTPADIDGDALLGLSLCAAGRTVDGWSRLLLLAALLVWLLSPRDSASPFTTPLAIGLGFAALEAWHALRLSIDRPVFAAWARTPAEHLPAAMRAFDASAAWVFGRKSDDNGVRSLRERVEGARRLFRRQIACLAIQSISLGTSLFLTTFYAHA
ncbi:MAG: hypothetical protein LBR88_07310 [Zoogloeaceae bacterium]|jgi:hypothetical protein|nr:hypothetical protein [Zoogloeaceae bacterium]